MTKIVRSHYSNWMLRF